MEDLDLVGLEAEGLAELELQELERVDPLGEDDEPLGTDRLIETTLAKELDEPLELS